MPRQRRWALQFISIALVLLLAIPPSFARDIFVNLQYAGVSDGFATKPYRTFTEAFAAAQSNDRIILNAGIYRERGLYTGKDLDVTSSAGTVTIGAPGPAPGFDGDHDGIEDSWELSHGLNPNDPTDAGLDPDNDGLTNLDEFQLGSSPTSPEHAGAIPGQFAVSSGGAATYAIPIAVPPGTAGMEPKLSLAYNSRSGNGLLGMGWGLSGLSTITRCSPTLAQDGFRDGVKFDDDDRFSLDGQRLIAVTGTYGSDGTEYRTEIDSFTRVISFGRTGNGPAFLRAWSKNGQILDYGLTSDSRVEAQGKPTIMMWLVNRITDTTGNFIAFTYTKNSATGECIPSSIQYTGNDTAGLSPFATVKFNYEARPDKSIAYQSGSALSSAFRMRSIETFISGALVNRHSFTYEVGTATSRSRLKTISLSDQYGNSLPATTCVSWTDQEARGRFSIRPRFNPVDYDLGANSYRYAAGDFDGDGVSDMIHFAAPEGVRVWLSKRDGTFDIQPPFPNNGYAVNANGYKFLSGDFNGDGIDDLFHVVNHSYGHAWLSRGDGTFSIRPPFPNNSYNLAANNYNLQTGDFDGDGRTDILHLVSPSEVRVFLSNGDGTFRLGPAWNPGCDISYNNYKVFIIDADGDGRSDVLHFANDTFVRVWLSKGDGTFKKLDRFPADDSYALSQNAYAFTTGDFNGDGLTDLLHFVDRDSVRVWLNKGDGTFSIKREFTTINGYAISDNNYNFKLGDFNGDGKTDLIHFADPDAVRVWTSRGDGTFIIEDAFPANGYLVSANNYKFLLGNFNSDSKTDMFHFVNRDYGHVWNAGGPLPDLLTLIVDGRGHTNQITYKPLTDSGVYTKDHGAVYPISDLQGPIYVVATHGMGDGLGGQSLTTYTYGGARMNRDRGFLGFRWQNSRVERTGIQRYEEYRQDYPFIGLLSAAELRTADNRLISRSINNYTSISSFGGSVAFPFASQSIAESYDLDGSLVSRITSSAECDTFGNSAVVDVTSDDGYRQLTISSFANDTERWILGKLTRSTVTASAPGQVNQTRTSSFEYTPTNGLLLRENVEPDLPHRQSTEYARDVFGNITLSTSSGPGVTPRIGRTFYDPTGRFPIAFENALGHRESRTYDSRFGTVSELISPNGQVSRVIRDGFGRTRREIRPDGVTTAILIAEPDSSSPPQTRSRLVTKTSGSAPSTVYLDALNRKIRIVTGGFDGRAVYRDFVYDLRGQLERVSRPYYSGDPLYWLLSTHDVLGRTTRVDNPDASSVRTEYHGLSTTVFNELNQAQTMVRNSQGWLIRGTDNAGNEVTHTYDVFGNLLNTRDPAGNVISNTYDIRGRKLRMSDPDAGVSQFAYNAFSEMIWCQDGKGQVFTTDFDVLGRIVRRTLPEGQISYAYDSAAHGLGMLADVVSYNGYRRSHGYDNLGRLESVMTTVDGEDFTVRNHFDALGRVDQITYPAAFAVRQVFNDGGFLSEVRDAADNSLLWRADLVNAEGLVVRNTLGNGLTTVRAFDPARSWIRSIETGSNGGDEVQSLGFSFDPLGNLTARSDNSRGLMEDFSYDGLNRLTAASVAHGATKTYSYDAIGNITFKSDVGVYSYDRVNAGPHAVTHAGNMTDRYSYDANGNMLGGRARTFAYYSFNKPSSITGVGARSGFRYDSENNLMTHTSVASGQTNVMTYVGGIYERNASSLRIEHRHFVGVGGTVVAIHTASTGQPSQLRFVHKDHLGSVQSITDLSGAAVERFSYDPHGRRRGDNWEEVPSGSRSSQITERGFGGHVQLDALEIVHMGGRAYDPVLGRFTTPDPFIQSAAAVQAFNRYSYVGNNPVSMVDPSGFWGLKSLFKKGTEVVDSVANSLGPVGDALTGGQLSVNKYLVDHPQVAGVVVGAVATVATGGAAAPLASAIVGGAASGLVSSQGDVKAAAYSAATALAFASVGNAIQAGHLQDGISQSVAHGVVGGVSAQVQGGNFVRGFLSAAVTKGLSGEIGSSYPGGGMGSMARDVISGAAVGGLASELSGGRFSDGAVTVAFSRLFNDRGHDFCEENPESVFCQPAPDEEGVIYSANTDLLIIGPIMRIGGLLYEGAAGIFIGEGVESAMARGVASEARVLQEMGFVKNTTAVVTSEGRAIPDALTKTLSVEVKDRATVSLTRQLRIQTGSASDAGLQSMLVTGQKTRIYGPAQEAFDIIIRRSDLGPK